MGWAPQFIQGDNKRPHTMAINSDLGSTTIHEITGIPGALNGEKLRNGAEPLAVSWALVHRMTAVQADRLQACRMTSAAAPPAATAPPSEPRPAV